MAIDRPRPGKCDAQIHTGRYCGNDIYPPATRCIAHGGGIQMVGGLKESLYTKRLRSCFKTPEDQKLFDEMPKSTDLGDEIRIARMRVVQYEQLLAEGTDVIFVKDKQKSITQAIADGESPSLEQCKTVALNVHDLHRDAMQSLRALCATQDAIHPGSDIGGNLRVTITLAGQAKPRLPIPDLTDDSNTQRLLPPTHSTSDVEPARPPRGPPRAGTGYEDAD